MSSKWIYKIKHATDGNMEKHKEIFMACGFSQKEGIDYEETFDPISSYTLIRYIITIFVVMKLKVHQMHVKNSFLNDIVE